MVFAIEFSILVAFSNQCDKRDNEKSIFVDSSRFRAGNHIIFARKEVTFLASRASPWQFTVPHSMPMSTHSKDMQAVSLIFKHECEYVNK